MPGVFVSYAREDAAKAQAIARALEQASLDVWLDQRIHSGSEYSREIEQALKDAAAVVVLWSRNSVESAWVRDEAAEGRDSGRLVPILIDDIRPPIGFRQFQTTDLSRWSGRGKPKRLDEVIAAVAAKAGAPYQQLPKPTTSIRGWRMRPRFSALALITVAALAVGAFLLVTRRWNQPQPAALSVALLPFTADSADADSRKLASAAHDSVAHTLSQGAFAVRTIDVAPQGDAPPGDFLISGRVTSTPQKFVATVRMEETAHHVVVFSHQFEASRETTGDFAERIGAQVAAQLSWTAPLLAVERRHPSDPAIIAALLQSSVSGLNNVGTLHDYETSRRLAVQAPNSPLAQNAFAFNTAFALGEIPRGDRADAVAAARRASDRTIELAPEFGGAYIPWCLLHSEQRVIQCEDRLRAGMKADPDGSFNDWFLSRLLNNVGRNREAAELASLSLAHDPYMPYKIGQMLRLLEVTGRTDEAAQLYEQSRRWWPDDDDINWYRESGMVLRGEFKALQQFADEFDRKKKSSPIILAIKRTSLPAVRTACFQAEDIDGILCMLALARSGDVDAAFALADRLYPSRRGLTPADEERIWLDNPGLMPLAFLTSAVAAPLRRDPRYLALAQRVGLLEYWRSGRLPDFCRGKPEPICSKLARR
jgi:hypothetical protein